MVIYFIICDVLSSHQLFVIFRSQNSQHNIIIPLKSPSKRSSGHCLVKETIKLASNQNFYSMTKTFTNTTNGFRSDDKSNRCILPIAVCLFVFCMALFFSCICVWWTYFGCLNLTLFVSMAIACWTKENKSSKKKKEQTNHIYKHTETLTCESLFIQVGVVLLVNDVHLWVLYFDRYHMWAGVVFL